MSDWLRARCVSERHSTTIPLFSIGESRIERRGYKNVHWEKRGSAGETKRIGSTMVESSVLFPVASVSSLEENGTSVVFSCSGDYQLIRQPMPPPSQSQGVSHVKLQKRNGTYWLRSDRRVTVDDMSSANALAGFFPSQIAPMQEGGATSSTDVAQQFPDAAEVGKTSEESVSAEQGQLLRAAEPHQCVLKVKAKPILETPTQRQRDSHELTHLPPVPWCPACVSGKPADDPHRRRQDARDSGLDVASFDHCDISAEVGVFNKKLRFKVLVSPRSGALATLEGPKDVAEHLVRFVCDMLETWSFGVCPQVSERASRDRSAERCCQDKAIQDDSDKHAQVFAWQFRSL